MSVSKAPAYRSAMFALIKSALITQTDVEINYGSTWVSDSSDIVLLRSVTSRAQFANAVGAERISEYLDLEIVIMCDRGGDDLVNGVPTQQIASERAWALLALIETRVRTDVSLGGLVYNCLRSRAQEVEGTPDDAYSGRHSEIAATFTAETRI